MKNITLIFILFLLVAGCTQPAEQPEITTSPMEVTSSNPVPVQPVNVTAQRFDSTKILITYNGGPDAGQLIELETTVITSIGSINIQSMGSRLDTTPEQIGGTDIFQGPYTKQVHVMTTGYFINGTHLDILDTRI
jgi:hypothetical protein